jgi:hypothetical protein
LKENTMKKLLILAALLGLLFAAEAWAAAFGFSNCRTVSITPPTINKAGLVACYEFDDDTDSGRFTVVTPSALVCLDPDITTEGPATAEVMIRRCHSGAAISLNECFAILDASLTGATGGPATQNSCARVGPGAYYIEITTSAGGDDAIVSITGE